MKLLVVFCLVITLLCSTAVSALRIPYEDMTDFEIAKFFASSNKATGNLYSSDSTLDQGKIVNPKIGDVWHVGENVNVTFSDVSANQTVSIFFFDLTDTLAGGSLAQKIFYFIVPAAAVSPVDGTSLLLAVRREDRYLQTVDSVPVKVVATPLGS